MKLTNEARIGILVAAVLVILGILTWKTGNYSFIPDGYLIKVHFKDVQGLAKNAPVTLNGFEQGRVNDVKIIYDGEIPQVELSLWLKSEAKVPRNAKAYVRMMGFMGEKYVALEMTGAQEGFLTPGSIIYGQDPSSLEKIVAEGEVIAKNIREISEAVNDHLKLNKESINDIIANLRVTSKNLGSITTNVNERLVVNTKHIDSMISNLDETSINLNEMSYDLKLHPWKLFFKPRIDPKTIKKSPENAPAAVQEKADK